MIDSSLPRPEATRPLQAVVWMVITGLCFVGVTATVKVLDGRVPAAEAAFLRYVLGLLFFIPMLPRLLRLRLSRRALGLFALRGLMQAVGVILWFYAMSRITLAEVTAMNYLNPIYVTIGAALFLGERFAWLRMAAILLAFLGALVILRPGVRALDPGHLAMLATAVLFAGSYLIAKVMTGLVSPSVIVAMLSVTVTICLAPFAAAVWVTPALSDLALLLLVAGFATAGHYTMTVAFRDAPMAVTQPVTFLQLVWATLLGALVFAEPVDVWVVTGGGLILAAVSFIAWREAWLAARRRGRTGIRDAS